MSQKLWSMFQIILDYNYMATWNIPYNRKYCGWEELKVEILLQIELWLIISFDSEFLDYNICKKNSTDDNFEWELTFFEILVELTWCYLKQNCYKIQLIVAEKCISLLGK